MGADIGEHPPAVVGGIPPDHQIPLQQGEPTRLCGVEVLQVADGPPLFGPGGMHDDRRRKRHDRELIKGSAGLSSSMATASVSPGPCFRELITAPIVAVGSTGFNQIEPDLGNPTNQS